MARFPVFLVGLAASLGSAALLPAQERPVTIVSGGHSFSFVNEDGVIVAKEAHALYLLDEKMKAAFVKKWPNVLPESTRKLPKATAKAFDWSKFGVTGPIYTQGRTPYCWAFASIEALECSWRIRNKQNTALAVQPIIDHSRAKGGSVSVLGFRSLMLSGTSPLARYPYTGRPGVMRKVPKAYRAVAYGLVAPGVGVPSTEALKEALLRHGPLVVSVHASQSFKDYRGGVYASRDRPGPGEQPTNHAVLLIGWNDKLGAWRIKNSWDVRWGIGGYMWIKYGSNNIGSFATWVRAQSVHYQLPADAHEQAEGAVPFYRWPTARKLALPTPE
jgi:cathepsin L